ncbi:MAG: hypothetical protein JRN21_09210 [Nitrososphaerota archaeon]|nr:hypothetical protein [Nitrososphaerota archaeon]
MVNALVELFLNTPAPYLLMFYVIVYRHDLGRYHHPFRDHDTPRDWVLVFRKIGVVPKDQPAQAYGTDALKIFPVVFLGLFIWWLGPFLAFGVWYQAIVAQLLSAIVLMSAITRSLGPSANIARRDHMRYPRLGSRVLHLRGDTEPGEKYD